MTVYNTLYEFVTAQRVGLCEITQHCGGFAISTSVALRIQVFWVVTQNSRVIDGRGFESTLTFRGHSDLQDQDPVRLVTSQDAAVLLQPSEPPTLQKINVQNLDRVTVWKIEAGAQKWHKEQSNILSNTVYIFPEIIQGLHVSAKPISYIQT